MAKRTMVHARPSILSGIGHPSVANFMMAMLLLGAPACGANTHKGALSVPDGGALGDASGTGQPGDDDQDDGSNGPPSEDVAPGTALVADEVTPPAGIDFTSAPGFSERIRYVPNRSSVMLFLPYVAAARDYRVFEVVDGLKTEITGALEDVVGATITCAGLRQRNECDNSQAISAYGPGPFHVSACSEDVRSVDTRPTLLRQIEVNALKGETVLVVEAIDTLCPFVGALGNVHADVPIYGAETPVSATYNGQLGQFPRSRLTFPIRTEQEVRAEYKSLILNGHGHAPRDPDPMKGPFYNLAQPAPRVAPRVLNRAFISVSPTGTAERPEGYGTADIFDDFEDDSDQFKLIKERKVVEGTILPEGFGPITKVKLFQNSRWNWYTFNGESAQMYIDKGELHTTLADVAQDVMASNVIYPKRAMKLPEQADRYLHITFETQTNATQRRYWWLHLCGAGTEGQTYQGEALRNDAGIVALPFFMNPTSGPTISMAGWNCLQFVPRGGDFEVLEGGDKHNPRLGGLGRPETDVRILVNRPTPAGQSPLTDLDSIVLLDPSMHPGNSQRMGGSWSRTWNDRHKINGMMLDEQMFVAQRTKLDFFVGRDRVVMYANGVQKACDNIGRHLLTMAEAAVGIGHVIYHSSAERSEFIESQWIRTGQNYYLWNTPFVDVRSFDNVGIREGVRLPSSFNPAPCFDTPVE